MGSSLINQDFLTPKKKSPDEIKDGEIREYTADEFNEFSDGTKEIIHYAVESGRDSTKRVNANPRNEYQTSNIPDWALLSVAAMPRRRKEIHDIFQIW